MNKESERVKYLLQNWSHLQLAREYEKLENIIKKVREIFKDYGDKEDIVGYTMYNITGEMLITLLEILDKGGEK